MANGIHGRASTVLNNEIIKLANNGMTTQQIADTVGLTRGAVGSRMSILISEGKLKRLIERTGSIDTARGRYDLLKGRYKRQAGSVMGMLMMLPVKQAEWLCRTTPEDMSVAEWCAVLLRDVISEEMGE